MDKDKKPIPTFDEWYRAKHMGFSFDAHYLKKDDDISKSMKALSQEMRNYVSEMVKP
jgi:hypothetical protein